MSLEHDIQLQLWEAARQDPELEKLSRRSSEASWLKATSLTRTCCYGSSSPASRPWSRRSCGLRAT